MYPFVMVGCKTELAHAYHLLSSTLRCWLLMGKWDVSEGVKYKQRMLLWWGLVVKCRVRPKRDQTTGGTDASPSCLHKMYGKNRLLAPAEMKHPRQQMITSPQADVVLQH